MGLIDVVAAGPRISAGLEDVRFGTVGPKAGLRRRRSQKEEEQGD